MSPRRRSGSGSGSGSRSASLPVVQVEREARELLRALAAQGEQLPSAPTVYGRPVLHAVTAPPPEPEGSDR
jgi:hypothetical protein